MKGRWLRGVLLNFCCGAPGTPAPNPVMLATCKGITPSSAAERFIWSRRELFEVAGSGPLTVRFDVINVAKYKKGHHPQAFA
jgi:hypothetical protein